MNGYEIPDDGKIHTHYSELIRCTPVQIRGVLNERAGFKKIYSSEGMDFGTTRHDMWKDESLETGKTPEVFLGASSRFQVKTDGVEAEFASEIFKGVILHSRLDAYGESKAIDYKTTTMDRKRVQALYNSSIQLKIYAYQLMIHDIPVEEMVYLIEHWNEDHSKILGYSKMVKPYLPRFTKEAQNWLKRRCEVLVTALEMFPQ